MRVPFWLLLAEHRPRGAGVSLADLGADANSRSRPLRRGIFMLDASEGRISSIRSTALRRMALLEHRIKPHGQHSQHSQLSYKQN